MSKRILVVEDQEDNRRIVRDLLQIPGKLTFVNGQLKQIELLSSHTNSKDLLICLEKYCLGD